MYIYFFFQKKQQIKDEYKTIETSFELNIYFNH